MSTYSINVVFMDIYYLEVYRNLVECIELFIGRISSTSK